MPKMYIEVADLVYHLKKNAMIDGQPRAIRRAAKMVEKFAEMYPADVEEVKHGEWVYHDCVSSYDGALSCYSCSVCGAAVREETFDSDDFHRTRCGECGAKMDGKENKDGEISET